MYFQPTVIYRDPKENRSHSIVKYIAARVLRQNKNFLCALTGQTGVGKSYAALSIAEIYSKFTGIHFNPDIHILHNIEQLLELINSQDVDKKIKIGTFLIFEEPQIEANARNWQSQINNIMSSLLSTFRNKRLVVFFTVPYLEFVDKQSRVLFHARFEVLGFNKNTGITTIKPRFLEYHPAMDYFYRKRLVVRHAVVGKGYYVKQKVGKWLIPKADKEVIKTYEDLKAKFSDDLNAKLLERIRNKDANKKEKQITVDYEKLKEIYLKHGEDYNKMLEIYPTISPLTIQRYLGVLKKAYGKMVAK